MTPEPNAMGQWIIIAGWVTMIVLGILQYADRRGTQRREIVAGPQHATQERVASLEQRIGNVELKIEALRAEMKEDREALQAQGEQRASKIHERISAMSDRITGELARISALWEADSQRRHLPGSEPH